MKKDTLAKSRFEYGRHETFAVRYGWLSKGLSRMESSANGFQADEAAIVDLGLGSRMVKSLRYWLEASGIGEMRTGTHEGQGRELHTSDLGRVIYDRDPSMEYPATWWFVHLKLAGRERSVWAWFFNDFRERIFDRPGCVDASIRHLLLNAANEPSLSAGQRDIACVLSAYAMVSTGEPPDPEDGTLSPLRDLGLVLRHEDTGRFEKTRPLDEVPVEVFLACASAQARSFDQQTLSTGDLLGRRGGPGTVLGLAGNEIEELASRASRDFRALGVTFNLLGAERRLQVPVIYGSHFWLDRHFQRVGDGV
jgi:hypothetical protein